MFAKIILQKIYTNSCIYMNFNDIEIEERIFLIHPGFKLFISLLFYALYLLSYILHFSKKEKKIDNLFISSKKKIPLKKYTHFNTHIINNLYSRWNCSLTRPSIESRELRVSNCPTNHPQSLPVAIISFSPIADTRPRVELTEIIRTAK